LFSKLALTLHNNSIQAKAWSLCGSKELPIGRVKCFSCRNDRNWTHVAQWADENLILKLRLNEENLDIEATMLLEQREARFAVNYNESFQLVTKECFKIAINVYRDLWENRLMKWRLAELVDDSYFVELKAKPVASRVDWTHPKEVIFHRFGCHLDDHLMSGANGVELYFPITEDDLRFLKRSLATEHVDLRARNLRKGTILIVGPDFSVDTNLHLGKRSKSVINKMIHAGIEVIKITAKELQENILERKTNPPSVNDSPPER
jgi:hypothetical protein